MKNTQKNEVDFKDKLNFKGLLEKNQKKQSSSPVSDLLRSTTQTILPQHNTSEQSQLNNQRTEQELSFKLSRIEGLVQSLIINQHNLKDSISNQIEYKHTKHQDFDYKSLIQTFLLVTTLCLSIFAIFKNQVSTLPNEQQSQKRIIESSQNKRALQTKSPSYFLTKYVNLRSGPSTKSDVRLILPINGMINIKEEKSGWSHIEYKDFAKDITYQGWIWGKNYKELKK